MNQVLYIVVRHPENDTQTWKNVWVDEDCIRSITTTAAVAEQCENAGIVYVHRGSYKPKNGKYVPPVISCSAVVEKVDRSSKYPVVHLKNATVVDKPVKRRLFFPRNSYYDVAPNGIDEPSYQRFSNEVGHQSIAPLKKPQTQKGEADLKLSNLIRESWRIYCQFENQPFLVKPSIPVLFFGDSDQYFSSKLRVITVGLNPSRGEFPQKDRFLRFNCAREVYPRILEEAFYNEYLESLNGYFRKPPNHPLEWFDCFEPLLKGLDCSYYGKARNAALHTDICSPLATDPTWKRLPPEVQLRLIQTGTPLWHSLVEWLSPDLIVASVAREHMERIQFQRLGASKVIHTIARKNPYHVEVTKLKIAEGKVASLVFGKAAQKPFGTVATIDKTKIGGSLKSSK